MTHPLTDQELVVLLLRELSNQLDPKFERCANMSLSRFELLRQLYQSDEMNQSTLQKSVNIDNAAVTRHLKLLEAQGMVARRRNPCDQRETFVCLTAEGRNQLQCCKSDKNSFVNRLLHDFEPEELQSLIQMLSRIQQNLKQL